jgi:PAS domain S-box-containing protein
MGLSGAQILTLLQEPVAADEKDLEKLLKALHSTPGPISLLTPPGSALEQNLIKGSAVLFLGQARFEQCKKEMRRLLTPPVYSHLIAFIAYVKTCHMWGESLAELPYETDRRAKDHLDALIKEESRLVEFFSSYNERIREERMRRQEKMSTEISKKSTEILDVSAKLQDQIVKHKQAADALRESEQRFRMLVSSMDDMVFKLDPASRFVAVFGRLVEKFNTAPSAFLRKTLQEVWPESADIHRRAVEEAMKGRTQAYEWSANGLQFQTSLAPLGESRNAVAGLVGVVRDVTERRKIEEALKDTNERLRAVLGSAADAIISADHQGCIISWNQASERIFGYSEKEILGQPLTVLMPERFREPHRKSLSRVSETGEAKLIGKTVELMGRRKDGREFPLELSLSMWTSGVRRFFTGILRDITKRRQVEDELRMIISVTQEIASAPNPDAAFNLVLQRMCETTGWKFGQVWVPDTKSTALKASPVWYGKEYEAFRLESEKVSFISKQGVVGTAWSTRKPLWVKDISQEPAFTRTRAAAKARFNSAMVIPVMAGDEILAVMEFFSEESRPEEDLLVKLVSAVASQIGALIRAKTE